MLPDNQDALKVWLIQTLNPICDADPDTLANYVLALIRKDKSEDDLIELCNRDLDVFLQDHTKSFVDTLFEVLGSKNYLHEIDNRHAGRPQASQKLANSTGSRPDQNPHLTSYKSLPKRDQEQIRPKEFEMKSRRPERRPDSDLGGRDKWRQERRHSKSPQSRERNDQSRDRRKFSQVRNRASEQPPRDVTSPPLRLGKRSYTRSLSKSIDPHEIEEHGRNTTRESSGSISPDGSTKAPKRNRSRSSSRDRREGVKKQRCRMYYERGFCELGDKCPYDHGKNPVLISNRELGLQNSFEYSPSNYLPPQGGVGPPTLLHQTVIPNISQPPPALPFTHRLPPAHFITQPGNALLLTQPPMRPMMPYGMPPTHRPPPPIYPFLPLPTGDLQQEVYQPGTMPVEPYLPEPYSSKPSHFSLPPPPIRAQSNLVKGAWKEEDCKQGEESTAPARQVSNLVHVNIDEGRTIELNSELLGGDQQYEVVSSGDGNVPSYTPTPSSVLNARKRSAKIAGLESVNPGIIQSEGFEDSKLMPPPTSYFKKPTTEHPGMNNRNQPVSNTTLELRKIPREDNTISNINGHFSKFGIIINLQVNWDNDPCAALVSYASSAQASAAYRSKEPFLNNRFIKIFWHNPEKLQQHQGGVASQNADSRSGDKDFKSKPKYTIPQRHQLQLNRLKKPEEVKKGQEAEVNPEKSEDEAPKATQDLTEEQQQVAPSLPATSDNIERIVIPPRSALKLQRKPDKEMQKPVNFQACAMKKEMEWRQKIQDLLKKLLATQKNLLELHDKSKSAEEKAKYSQLLKNNDTKIQEFNEELKKPFNSSSSSLNVDTHKKPFPIPKNKYTKNNKLVRTNSNSGLINPNSNPEDSHEAQKALLDGELDMIANKKEADVLRKKISDIKNVIGDLANEDADPSSSSSSYSYNKFNYNQTSSRGGRTFAKVSRSVDRRPRQILIIGFPLSLDKATLLNHMKNFGQVEKSLFDDKSPFLLVTYKYRSDAERAMKDGGMLDDIKLKLNWHNSEIQQVAKQPSTQPVTQTASSLSFSSSSSSTHIHLGLVDQKPDDQPEFTSDSNAHSVEDGGASPSGGVDGYTDDDFNEYRRWGDVEEDALLYEEDEEDEDDDEGVRPWRRR